MPMDDIEEIRKRKMRQIGRRLQEKKLREDQREVERREVERILTQVLKPDAHEYLRSVRAASPYVGKKIEDMVITLVVQRRIWYKIDKVIIRAIERKVRGIEPTISFMRKGKKMEISEKLREAE